MRAGGESYAEILRKILPYAPLGYDNVRPLFTAICRYLTINRDPTSVNLSALVTSDGQNACIGTVRLIQLSEEIDFLKVFISVSAVHIYTRAGSEL